MDGIDAMGSTRRCRDCDETSAVAAFAAYPGCGAARERIDHRAEG